MAIAVCNGIDIYYEMHGAGEPLILVSGLGGDSSFWASSLELLSARYQVICFDARGSGRSDMPPGPYSMETFAADLAGLMDALQLPAAHVLGFSMGGNIALQLALDHPERVRRLILAATHAAVPPQIRLYVDAVLEVYEQNRSPAQMFALIAPWLFSNRFLGRPGSEAYLAFDADDPYPQPLDAWKAQYLAQRAFDVSGRLDRIGHPTLILAADADPFAPLQSAELLHRGIAGSVLRVVRDSGHLMNVEHPGLFHAAVLEFLDQG